MSGIEAVLFDIGNVLIDWQPEAFYDRRIGAARRRALFDAVDMFGANDRMDRGAPLRETFYDLAEAHPEFGPEIRLWHDSWSEFMVGEIPQSVRLLRALQNKGVPVFALTNFGNQTLAMAEQRFGFLREFQRRYVSAELRMMKPEPEIYAAVEADCGLAPERLLFTDDRAENVAAAAARGWQTHHFTGPEGLARALVDHRLLCPGEAGL